MTFLAAPRRNRVGAPWLLGGPINGEQVLTPNVARGDQVITVNLGSHKAKAVHRAICLCGAKLLFLPKYPSDLNPIEQFFGKP